MIQLKNSHKLWAIIITLSLMGGKSIDVLQEQRDKSNAMMKDLQGWNFKVKVIDAQIRYRDSINSLCQ